MMKIYTDIPCRCGAGNRAHKSTCPLSSRNHYQSCVSLLNEDDDFDQTTNQVTGCRVCASTTQERPKHKECPYNKHSMDKLSDVDDQAVIESEQTPFMDEDVDDEIYRDIPCKCGAGNRAHKYTCPLSSRNCYQSCVSLLNADNDFDKTTNQETGCTVCGSTTHKRPTHRVSFQ